MRLALQAFLVDSVTSMDPLAVLVPMVIGGVHQSALQKLLGTAPFTMTVLLFLELKILLDSDSQFVA
jgi:hypothetical protein